MQTWKTRDIQCLFDNRCVDICGQRNVVKYMASKIHMDENSLYPGEYLPAFGVCAGRYEL